MKLNGNYYVAVRSEGETWEAAECCPFFIGEGEVTQQDGMYGLYDEVFKAMFGSVYTELSEAQDEEFNKQLNAYLNALQSALEAGQLSGTLDGVAGKREWQVVQDGSGGYPHPFKFEAVAAQ